MQLTPITPPSTQYLVQEMNVTHFCKRLPSHTGQEQACTRITWLFGCLFVTMPKMAEYTDKQLLTPPSTAQYTAVQSTTAHHSPIQPSKDQYSPVQPSSAQYSPIQPSTAQRSPLQPTTTSAGESIPPCIHLYTVQTVFCTEAPWSCINSYQVIAKKKCQFHWKSSASLNIWSISGDIRASTRKPHWLMGQSVRRRHLLL